MSVFPQGREDTSGKVGKKIISSYLGVCSQVSTLRKEGNIATSLTWPSILFASSF